MASDTREHTYLMKDNYYTRLEQALPKTEKVLFSYIAKYRDRNIKVLSSPYPDKLNFLMEGEDMKILYKVSNIDKDEMKKDVSKIKLPGNATKKNSLNSDYILFILLIRYYMTRKDYDKLRAITLYFAYCIYGLRFNIQFRPYGANHNVMVYTINNATLKFKLKEYGSIDRWLTHIFFKSMQTYEDKFQRLSDRDIDELISALYTRISSAVKNIRQEYENVIQNKNVTLESDTFIEGTNTELVQKTYTTEIEELSLEYTEEFFSIKPGAKRILYAARASNTAFDELQVTLDKIYDNADIKEMRTFLQCLFTIFFQSISENNINQVSVKNFKFVQVMDSIFRKGHSKDKNILMAKDLIDGWLRRGSATFRRTTRIPTIAEYRRGVYMYFLLLIAGIG